MRIIYTALFVKDQRKLLELFPPKHSVIYAHHSTVQFKPDSLGEIKPGKECVSKVIGRVFDDKGDALMVENAKSCNKYPHITISCVEGVAPKYSSEMIGRAFEEDRVEYLKEPLGIQMVEGYFDGEKDILAI